MSSYVEADLADSERRRVDRHVRFCPRCGTVLANLRHTMDRLGELGHAPAWPDVDAVAEHVRSRWRERT